MINISKQLACQKFIYKIHSSRLARAKWNLTLPIDEARRNDEIISIADSQILRWIDELNGVVDADSKAREIKRRIRFLRKQESGVNSKRSIQAAYAELDDLQFKPDYMCLIIDSNKDYYRAVKGFCINGIRYRRLLGTNGGIKNSTIVFVSERLADELRRRIDNGRDPTKELVTAKLEAYKALTCSASNPVSMPSGILIVNDAETEFLSDVNFLTDECDGEPRLEERQGEKIQLNASDGFGLMLPSLSERWSAELGLDYMVSGVNSRFAFMKGMIFTFDFIAFAEQVAHSYIVKDAWGNDVDIRSVELVLTTSMVKLWDSYKSCNDYLKMSALNGYTFGVSKTAPEQLENERTLNYQFIQSYDLSDDDIDELIAPTMNEINDVLHGDWRKTLLFLKGAGLNEKNVASLPDDYIKAIMIDRRVLDDPYVQKNIFQLIKNRINEAKVGVLKVHGNYSIVSGDPFLLCQSIFGLKKTGLLGSGEIYNRYWSDHGADRLACFRAPMSVHNNVRLVRPVDGDDAKYWYQYMNTVTILNSWDTITMALNGCDFDGDIVMLTDNKVLVDRLKPLPALMCVQRKAQKRISDESDFVRSNIESFGNEIGQTTNWITSMYEVQAGYEPGSLEYKTLQYRIACGQLYQQNVIDKSKGIIAKPMPRSWHDRHAVNNIENDETRKLYRSIIADRKPYFMRYIYPDLMREYNNYIKNTNRKSMREFQITVDALRSMPYDELSERQREFLWQYYRRMPVGTHDCVMNKICRKFEEAFDGYIKKYNSSASFDYSILLSGATYTRRQYQAVKRLFEDYNKALISYSILSNSERGNSDRMGITLTEANEEFRKRCDEVCSNSATLCDIVLSLCYQKGSTKSFAWNMCGHEIIQNLLKRNGNRLLYPCASDDGDIEYCGKKFEILEKEIEVGV